MIVVGDPNPSKRGFMTNSRNKVVTDVVASRENIEQSGPFLLASNGNEGSTSLFCRRNIVS